MINMADETSVNEIRLKQLESRVAFLEKVIEKYQKKFEEYLINTSQVSSSSLKIVGDVRMNDIGEAIFVTGKDTYKYKGILKELGGKWEKTSKCWVFEKNLRETLIGAGIN